MNYATRQSMLSASSGADITFDNIERANNSISLSEFLKLGQELLPVQMRRKELTEVFYQSFSSPVQMPSGDGEGDNGKELNFDVGDGVLF
jgi:hypothetical protein